MSWHGICHSLAPCQDSRRPTTVLRGHLKKRRVCEGLDMPARRPCWRGRDTWPRRGLRKCSLPLESAFTLINLGPNAKPRLGHRDSGNRGTCSLCQVMVAFGIFLYALSLYHHHNPIPLHLRKLPQSDRAIPTVKIFNTIPYEITRALICHLERPLFVKCCSVTIFWNKIWEAMWNCMAPWHFWSVGFFAPVEIVD